MKHSSSDPTKTSSTTTTTTTTIHFLSWILHLPWTTLSNEQLFVYGQFILQSFLDHHHLEASSSSSSSVTMILPHHDFSFLSKNQHQEVSLRFCKCIHSTLFQLLPIMTTMKTTTTTTSTHHLSVKKKRSLGISLDSGSTHSLNSTKFLKTNQKKGRMTSASYTTTTPLSLHSNLNQSNGLSSSSSWSSCHVLIGALFFQSWVTSNHPATLLDMHSSYVKQWIPFLLTKFLDTTLVLSTHKLIYLHTLITTFKVCANHPPWVQTFVTPYFSKLLLGILALLPWKMTSFSTQQSLSSSNLLSSTSNPHFTPFLVKVLATLLHSFPLLCKPYLDTLQTDCFMGLTSLSYAASPSTLMWLRTCLKYIWMVSSSTSSSSSTTVWTHWFENTLLAIHALLDTLYPFTASSTTTTPPPSHSTMAAILFKPYFDFKVTNEFTFHQGFQHHFTNLVLLLMDLLTYVPKPLYCSLHDIFTLLRRGFELCHQLQTYASHPSTLAWAQTRPPWWISMATFLHLPKLYPLWTQLMERVLDVTRDRLLPYFPHLQSMITFMISSPPSSSSSSKINALSTSTTTPTLPSFMVPLVQLMIQIFGVPIYAAFPTPFHWPTSMISTLVMHLGRQLNDMQRWQLDQWVLSSSSTLDASCVSPHMTSWMSMGVTSALLPHPHYTVLPLIAQRILSMCHASHQLVSSFSPVSVPIQTPSPCPQTTPAWCSSSWFHGLLQLSSYLAPSMPPVMWSISSTSTASLPWSSSETMNPSPPSGPLQPLSLLSPAHNVCSLTSGMSEEEKEEKVLSPSSLLPIAQASSSTRTSSDASIQTTSSMDPIPELDIHTHEFTEKDEIHVESHLPHPHSPLSPSQDLLLPPTTVGNRLTSPLSFLDSTQTFLPTDEAHKQKGALSVIDTPCGQAFENEATQRQYHPNHISVGSTAFLLDMCIDTLGGEALEQEGEHQGDEGKVDEEDGDEMVQWYVDLVDEAPDTNEEEE
ncbi:hypothetical protein HMI54_003258 [Coelomomyces lativittatus]|nr:hypothetical protein HMI54_003258 [Coelomomyces lativittatus]KAJ1508442.1 hypothetical protein HMI56_007288 [Coelomomyces lativittatus]KAJ1516666.1 hypothetical protein HMI55_001716 [Coelomomyces lativittatus]